MTDPVRLSKYLAALIGCSRREAELYIAGGWVLVDGQIVEEPQFRVSGQKVELMAGAKPEPIEPATVLLHMPPEPEDPAQLVTPANRAAEDTSGMRVLKRQLSRLSVELPLQAGASGMTILTEDGRVARKLRDDALKLEQEYVVEVSGSLVADGLDVLNRGLEIDGIRLPPAKVSWQNETRLRFALKGPREGQIAAMCQSVGLSVIAMKRIRIGRLAMGKLLEGTWRYLTARERF